MEIKSSLDWNKTSIELEGMITGIGFNPDLRRMLGNIEVMVSGLSKLEVEARRTRNYSKVNDQLAAVNGAINKLEQWMVMATLLR